MLNRLSVNNFALIENAELNLKNSFTVITGETGSGKSILLGALKLILGERADYSVIRDKDKKTIVEALFQLDRNRFESFFTTNDLDFEPDTLIRREINAKGKSRAFINDTPVQLTVLKELSERLIHIHSQHHTLELKNKSYQREILDVIAGNESILNKFKGIYAQIKSLKSEIATLKENKAKLSIESEFNSFQLEELNKLQLDQINYAQIEEEVQRGEQFEEIKNAYQIISEAINTEEGVFSTLNRVIKSVSIQDDKVTALIERLQSVNIELNDIGTSAENDLSDLTFSPEELNKNIELLDGFNAALRKHNLTTQEELKLKIVELSEDVNSADQIEERIEEKQMLLHKVENEALEIAEKLSKKRKESANKIEKQVKDLLNQLKLVGATIKFEFSATTLNEFGVDDITLFFAPNKGIEPKIIEKSASGGELSRLMLVVQFLMSQKKALPTVIFDEIDTGVSGEVAQKIGEHLKKMGERMQLLAITHLPQVASKGSHHILVKKQDIKGVTKTSLLPLNEEQRIEEIAKLMSGSVVNEAALLNAKNLMNE
ncbi:DNA repair protein RecN [Brumimicrobium salinarum]|uniref:DNA repair protein RecN n=1 Tax=Brumimicrobium salinarum TaxID=2058658 RepID=A0A2I0R4S0_9FLAO|nr:DNA repair protein RecN [Brumimicrobium salinarum]PKR81565.1 DNA repair protein RecN [Brumimicrobium salinarum]